MLSMVIFPEEGSKRPRNKFNKVVFPEPESPVINTLSPLFMVKFKF